MAYARTVQLTGMLPQVVDHLHSLFYDGSRIGSPHRRDRTTRTCGQ